MADAREQDPAAADMAEENDLRQIEHDSARAGYPLPPLSEKSEEWQDHHARHYGGKFEDYEAAYRHGFEEAHRTAGKEIPDTDAHLRQTWEAKRPGTYEALRDAIHYGFQSLGAP